MTTLNPPTGSNRCKVVSSLPVNGRRSSSIAIWKTWVGWHSIFAIILMLLQTVMAEKGTENTNFISSTSVMTGKSKIEYNLDKDKVIFTHVVREKRGGMYLSFKYISLDFYRSIDMEIGCPSNHMPKIPGRILNIGQMTGDS